MDEKESTREMYEFGNNTAALDLFYDGILYNIRGDSVKAINAFNKAIELMPNNPYIYQFRILVGKHNFEPMNKLKILSEKWLEVAINSNNEKQIARARFILEYCSVSESERKEIVKEYRKKYNEYILGGKHVQW